MHRKAVMEAIRYVDEVVEFGSDEALQNAIQWSEAKFIGVGAEYKGPCYRVRICRGSKIF